MIRSLAVVAAVLAMAAQAQATPPVKAPPSVYDRCLAGPAGRTQAGAIACVDAEIRRQEATMDGYYQSILKDMIDLEQGRGPPEAFASDPVRAAQRAWIAFRDADCRLYPSSTWGARGALDARKCVLGHIIDRVNDFSYEVSPQPAPPPGATFVGPSPCEKKARTGRDMSVCAAIASDRSDAELNRAYKALLAQLAPGDQEVLRVAQRSWIAFRDAECQRYADDRVGGTQGGYEATTCVDGATSARIYQLRTFLKSHSLRASR
jgi:uncharacterized protein YecT (DUF1311 family)